MRSKLAAVAVALASSTCCPSLFLSVREGKPAPRMPMPDPAIAELPIPTPTYLRNKFLAKTADESAPNAKKVLDAEIDQFSGYTDMPREKNQLVRALGSLEQLEDAYGIARRPRLKLTGGSEPEWPTFQGVLGCDDHGDCDEIRNISKRALVPNAQDRLDAFNEIEKANKEIEEAKAAEQASAAQAACKASAATLDDEAKNAETRRNACLKAETAKTTTFAMVKEEREEVEAEVMAAQVCSDRKAKKTQEIEQHFDACIASETAARPTCMFESGCAVEKVCSAKKTAEVRMATEELNGCMAKEVPVAREAKASEVALNAWIAKGHREAKEAEEAREARMAREATEVNEADLACKKLEFEADQVVEIFVDGQSEASYRRVVESAPHGVQGSKGCMIKLRGGFPGSNDARIKIHVIHGAEMPRLSQTMLSFVHVTDVQLRDPNARLGNEQLSHRLDWLVQQSFEYDRDLVFGNMYIMQSLIATINKEVHCSIPGNCSKSLQTGDANEARSRDEPAFVIHTGDAIDAGLMSELSMFHRLVDGLNVPFFNVLGNHDVLVFGNLMPTLDPHSDAACAPVTSIGGAESEWLQRLPIGHKLCVVARVRCSKGDCEGVRSPELVVSEKGNDPITHANARAHFIAGFEHVGTVVPMPMSYEWYPKTQPERPQAENDVGKSSQPDVAVDVQKQEEERKHREWCTANVGARIRPWLHGFVDDPRNANHPAYYAFPSKLAQIDDGAEDRNLISVVLDTDDLLEQEAGVRGRIQRTQMTWLSNVLDCARPKDLVIVFGHHAISGIQTDVKGEFERLLRAHTPNVIAYMFGHDHKHQICGDTRENQDEVCTKFWEVQTASLLEFPQEARRVKIKYAGRGMAFLEVVAFHENLANRDDDLGRAVARARTAAELDRCRTAADVKCSDDHRVYRTDGHDTNARLWFKLP